MPPSPPRRSVALLLTWSLGTVVTLLGAGWLSVASWTLVHRPAPITVAGMHLLQRAAGNEVAAPPGVYVWPPGGLAVPCRSEEMTRAAAQYLMHTWPTEWRRLHPDDRRVIREQMLPGLMPRVAQQRALPDTLRLVVPGDARLEQLAARHVAIGRYAWLGYDKTLLAVHAGPREGGRLWFASFSDASANTGALRLVGPPFVVLGVGVLFLMVGAAGSRVRMERVHEQTLRAALAQRNQRLAKHVDEVALGRLVLSKDQGDDALSEALSRLVRSVRRPGSRAGS